MSDGRILTDQQQRAEVERARVDAKIGDGSPVSSRERFNSLSNAEKARLFKVDPDRYRRLRDEQDTWGDL